MEKSLLEVIISSQADLSITPNGTEILYSADSPILIQNCVQAKFKDQRDDYLAS